MKSPQLLSAVAAALLSGLAAIAQAQTNAPEQNPFAVLPFNDPLELQQLVTLNDSEFLSRLFDSSGGLDILDRFFPPGTTVFPVSHGFAGPQDACLKNHTVLACRFYVVDLMMLNEEKALRNRVFANPFVPAR